MITVILSNGDIFEFSGENLMSFSDHDGFFTISRKYFYDTIRTEGRLWWKKEVKCRGYGFKAITKFKFSSVERVEFSDAEGE